LPFIFPPAVLARAITRPFIPPTPRLAIESYWRSHPFRAEYGLVAVAAIIGLECLGLPVPGETAWPAP
jgi:hypothetical protein